MTAHRPTLLEALALVSPFRGRTEDIAVEALGHILSTSEAARAALADVVDTGGAPVGPIARVRTQVTGEKGARPDLAGFDENGFERVLIEAKFAAGLTDNQPVAYLERLQRVPDGRPAALLFVSPAARVESLWTELCRRAKTSGIALESVRKAGRVRSAAIAGGGPRLLLASWTALLDRMLNRVATEADSQAEAEIQQLRGLADREGKDLFRPLRPEELQDRDSPLLVLLVEELIDLAVEQAKRRKVATKPQKQSRSWGYGQWLRLAGVDVWFGIHFDRWVRTPTALLWLWFRRGALDARGKKARIALEPLRSREPQELFDDDERGLLVPVPLPPKVGAEAVGASVTAWRESLATGAELSDVERRRYVAMLEPVFEAMVARLEEVRQLLRATSGRGGTKTKGAVPRYSRPGRVIPGDIPAAVAAGMRKDFPRRVGSLRRLVDDATSRGKGEGWAEVQGHGRRSGYGRYLRFGRIARAQVWFGILFQRWVLQPPATPLWLWFTSHSLERREQTRGALESMRRKDPFEVIDDGAGGLFVPVLLPVDEGYDAVLEAVVKRLEEVARLLDGP